METIAANGDTDNLLDRPKRLRVRCPTCESCRGCVKRHPVWTVALIVVLLAGSGVGIWQIVRLFEGKSIDVRISALAVRATGAASAGGRDTARAHGSAPSVGASGAARPMAISPDLAVRSATASAYARVDELDLTVVYVRLAPTEGGGSNLLSTQWGAGRALRLSDRTTLVAIEDSIDVKRFAKGTDNRVDCMSGDFVFWQRWTMKAFCRTANRFVYTTAEGVATLPDTPTVMPSDYAPLLFDYMPDVPELFAPLNDGAGGTGVYSMTRQQNHSTFINSVYEFTISSATPLSLVVDLNYVVACYDGTVANASVAGQQVFPVGQDAVVPMQGDAPSPPFDWTKPAVLMQPWVLPVFVDALSQITTGATYALAPTAEQLPCADGECAVDWAPLVIMTTSWTTGADGSLRLLDVRVRGSNSQHGYTTGFGVPGGCFGPTLDADGTWSVSNGQQYNMKYQMIRDRTIRGIAHISASATGTITVVDGPECGADPGRNPGATRPQPYPCSNATTTWVYRELARGR
jgi:hypothetical protein